MTRQTLPARLVPFFAHRNRRRKTFSATQHLEGQSAGAQKHPQGAVIAMEAAQKRPHSARHRPPRSGDAMRSGSQQLI